MKEIPPVLEQFFELFALLRTMCMFIDQRQVFKEVFLLKWQPPPPPPHRMAWALVFWSNIQTSVGPKGVEQPLLHLSQVWVSRTPPTPPPQDMVAGMMRTWANNSHTLCWGRWSGSPGLCSWTKHGHLQSSQVEAVIYLLESPEVGPHSQNRKIFLVQSSCFFWFHQDNIDTSQLKTPMTTILSASP